jgi:hypothetical protein
VPVEAVDVPALGGELHGAAWEARRLVVPADQTVGRRSVQDACPGRPSMMDVRAFRSRTEKRS